VASGSASNGGLDFTVQALAKAHSRVGTDIAGARLSWLLGVGQFAAAYAAEHPRHGAIAAKILHDDLAARTDVRARFAREIELTRSLVHPGVVRVFEDGATEHTRFVFLERLEGESLQTRLMRMGGRLPVREVHTAIGSALLVMAFAHERGVVHRDLSPKNVFITRSSGVYILDFGIAASPQATALTRSGHVLGTPSFMAPEQARGDSARATPRSDVWSVGAMAFRLLAGRDVHPARSPSAQILLAASTPAPPLAHLAPHVPDALAAVIDRALSFETEARWADARDLHHAWISTLA
jgi:eukaryotic-like serine/threonine-protein kinase